ncbi:HAD-IIIC family phosphatase [Mariniphaga sediminis]|uniref:HAD-IIIC family phosphatase n=1 Tax=Mariniphaga sediminis TaxID=1628158 RepID=A0A399D296_9BACT|nr:HAD-IIIC family phosphatase [Mariniphaga sediminis]RIH65697.1 HAD-IIIC family phosphatase [Mariniphaga sediminis]
MKDFSTLKKNLKKDFSNLKKIKVAVLGDTATQFLVQAIRGEGFEEGFDLEIWEADFNQIERQVLDHTSELYEFNPQIVVIFQSSHKLLGKYNKQKPEKQNQFALGELEQIKDLTSNITGALEAKLIYYNYTEIDDAVFGNFANKTPGSFLFQLRKLNYELMCLASENPNIYLCDISSVQNRLGKVDFFKPSIYINTEMVLNIDALPAVASATVRLISALQGKIKKCVILDLDNTLWGGVIGDDGLENIQIGSLGIGKAFTEFQYWIKKLKNRGVIVAVCSKNTESVAKEPFEKHPDMVLRLDDISVFIANWENKADNIRQIQSILNIGFDSMVFLDDNPFERNIVRENIPEICVPELPEDPADYLEYLYSLNLFETVSYSKEDADRTKLYQIEAQRVSNQKKYTNVDDFLKSLDMYSLVEPFNKFNTPRVAQLTQRSNQFNLRTIRYTEADIERISASGEHHSFTFTLEDKFGDNGLICVVILKQESSDVLFVDTWLMSCRVLKRGMENFVLNILVDFALEMGFSTLKGEYLPTAKNAMVKDHYADLGFEEEDDSWILNVYEYKRRRNYIKPKKELQWTEVKY